MTTFSEQVQSSAKRWSLGLVNFVTSLAYHFCLALPAAFTQPGDHLLDEPCTCMLLQGINSKNSPDPIFSRIFSVLERDGHTGKEERFLRYRLPLASPYRLQQNFPAQKATLKRAWKRASASGRAETLPPCNSKPTSVCLPNLRPAH